MKLEANNIIITALLPTAFDLDAKALTPTAPVEAKLLPEGYPAARLLMRSWVTRRNNNR